MAGRQVTIQFLGDAKGLISASGAAGRSTSTLASKFKNLGKIAAVGVAAGTAVAAKALWDMTEAAAADEVEQRRLALTLKNATGATKDQIASTEDWITAQGKALGVADDDLRPALGKLAVATGDVTRAQRLASLAMDVAAGSGKSLDQVTTALQKGVNGSVGGLARLGVKTKDVSGETLTLSQITSDLAKKYKGAAADSADTAAGKFQRLKVNMSELGEEIGYKVLPYATEFGEWLLDKGIPAAEDLTHWAGDQLSPVMSDLADLFRENKDELQDFAEGAGKQAVGILGDLTEFAGDAVGLFEKLPDPVKSLGVEAAVAAAVLPRFAAGLTVASASAGTFATNIGTASTRSRSLTKGLGLLAGVGGMVAITEGSKEGSDALGILGGALTGAFVGGTIGSAIPGIGTAIGGVAGAAVGAGVGFWKMYRGSEAASGSAKDSKPTYDGLIDTLDQVTGAVTKQTDAFILNALEQGGVLEGAQQLGIATSDLIKASKGNQQAIKRVTDAWTDQGDILDAVQGEPISDWLQNMRGQLGKSRADILRANAALDGTDKSARKASEALKLPGKNRPHTNEWKALFLGDLDKAETGAEERSRKIRQWLSEEPGKARTNMGPYTRDLAHQLNAAQQAAHNAAAQIAAALHNALGLGPGASSGGGTKPRTSASPKMTQIAGAGRMGGGGNLTVNINGALDPMAVGKQVEQILIKYVRGANRPLQVRTI